MAEKPKAKALSSRVLEMKFMKNSSEQKENEINSNISSNNENENVKKNNLNVPVFSNKNLIFQPIGFEDIYGINTNSTNQLRLGRQKFGFPPESTKNSTEDDSKIDRKRKSGSFSHTTVASATKEAESKARARNQKRFARKVDKSRKKN